MFNFGRNWKAYLEIIEDSRISQAKAGLEKLLAGIPLSGKTFLDAGSGSGLHSLAAVLMGAKVRSFDVSEQCVECAKSLKQKFAPSSDWEIETGSALDAEYLRKLGQFDIVYSWGVLHHTGDLWKALDLAARLVKPGGTLVIAVYNHQGFRTKIWKAVKWSYNALPSALRFLILVPAFARIWGPAALKDFLRGRPFQTWRSYKLRGMDPWIDVVDWVGGYPFEAAYPQKIIDFYKERGFSLANFIGVGSGWGCNEFSFVKNADGQI